jgi:hypothetical protein
VAYDRLKGLGEERFNLIQKSLVDGLSPNGMATKIRDEWGEFLDVNVDTLTQQLKRLKNELQESNPTYVKKIVEDAPVLLDSTPKKIKQVAEEEEKEEPVFDYKARLLKLVDFQEQRIQNLIEKEKGLPMPLPAITPLIKDLTDLLAKIENADKAEISDIWVQLFDAGGIEDVG